MGLVEPNLLAQSREARRGRVPQALFPHPRFSYGQLYVPGNRLSALGDFGYRRAGKGRLSYVQPGSIRVLIVGPRVTTEKEEAS